MSCGVWYSAKWLNWTLNQWWQYSIKTPQSWLGKVRMSQVFGASCSLVNKRSTSFSCWSSSHFFCRSSFSVSSSSFCLFKSSASSCWAFLSDSISFFSAAASRVFTACSFSSSSLWCSRACASCFCALLKASISSRSLLKTRLSSPDVCETRITSAVWRKQKTATLVSLPSWMKNNYDIKNKSST